MTKGKILVIGDKLNLPLFRSTGIHVEEADNSDEIVRILKNYNGRINLAIVLKHTVDDQDKVLKTAEELDIPLLILPTLWSPAEKINVEKLLAKALGLG